jgi:hypothetical protein
MSDYEQTRNAAGKVVTQYSKMLSSLEDQDVSWYQECIENLTVELQLAVAALGKVQAFVKDLDLYADQGTMLHPALYEACMVYERLKK